MAVEKEKAPKAAEKEQQPEPKPKPPLMKYLIIGGVVLVQIAGSYFLQKSLFFDNVAEAGVDTDTKIEAGQEGGHGEASEAKHGEGGTSDAPVIIMLDEIIVNPAGTEGRRYLATRVGLQTQSDSAEAEVTARSVLIRDAVISLLSSKSMAQLSSLTYRDSLRSEIKIAVNDQLTKTVVESVVFADYVLQ